MTDLRSRALAFIGDVDQELQRIAQPQGATLHRLDEFGTALDADVLAIVYAPSDDVPAQIFVAELDLWTTTSILEQILELITRYKAGAGDVFQSRCAITWRPVAILHDHTPA